MGSVKRGTDEPIFFWLLTRECATALPFPLGGGCTPFPFSLCTEIRSEALFFFLLRISLTNLILS